MLTIIIIATIIFLVSNATNGLDSYVNIIND